METIKYLLVTEGPTDFIILEKISSIISKNIDKHIEFVQLSPQKDQTSDRYSDHGWKEVRKWCRLYGKNKDDLANVFARLSSKSKNWKTLVKVSNAKGIIIQIDTDIAEYIDEINFRYQGTSAHDSTSFRIEHEITGEVVFEIEDYKNNLLSIKTPLNILKPNSVSI